MIKKLKFSLLLLIGLFGIINFSSAGYTRQIGVYGYNPYTQGIDLAVLNKGQLLSDYLGSTKRIMFLNNNTYYFWGYNGNMYIHAINNNHQGFATHYYVCPVLQGNETMVGTNGTILGGCSQNVISSGSINTFGTFLNSLTNNDYFFFNSDGTFAGKNYMCISSSALNSSLCFSAGFIDGNSSLSLGNGGFDSVNSTFLYDPPSYSQGGGGTGNDNDGLPDGIIATGSNESAINYFENRYGRNENICYVGVNNITDLWGSSVSFQEGSGLTIFEAFENLYGNQDPNKVYVWLNSRLLNYEQWFGRNGNPLYLSSYNSGTNQVDLYYDNLTFPFSNNPVAVYFMSDYISRNSEYSTMGSEVVSYCNIKLNDGSFDEIIDQAVKNNINNYTVQSNKNKGYNPGFNYNGGDAWLSSGVEIAFSGNTTISNTLENFFGKLEDGIDSLKVTSEYKIFPDWLIASFVFIVLFKFLRKKK